LVRSVPESEWTPTEQGWMLALGLFDDLRCAGCGGDLRETTAHEDWVVSPPMQCHRCEAIAVKQDAYAADYPHPHTFLWAAKRR
jgi:hypothetical protein